MPYHWVEINLERLEYRTSNPTNTCVAEVFKRFGKQYEAVAFKKGQRSTRLLLHRGDSATQAMAAVVKYFHSASTAQDAAQELNARSQTAAATAPGSGEPSALPPR